jgi:bifunctional non-homologous end joining protein LigD
MLRKIPFIKPMAPTLARIPPAGSDWIHEVKFDGWRMHIHVDGKDVALYSKNGTDFTKRFRALNGYLLLIFDISSRRPSFTVSR